MGVMQRRRKGRWHGRANAPHVHHKFPPGAEKPLQPPRLWIGERILKYRGIGETHPAKGTEEEDEGSSRCAPKRAERWGKGLQLSSEGSS